MKQDYLSNYLPEKGCVYVAGKKPKDIKGNLFESKDCFALWMGYFSIFFKLIMKTYGHKQLAKEFEYYYLAEDFENIEIGDDFIKINPLKTLEQLKCINKNFSTLYKEGVIYPEVPNCLKDLISFLELNKDKDVYLGEDW